VRSPQVELKLMRGAQVMQEVLAQTPKSIIEVTENDFHCLHMYLAEFGEMYLMIRGTRTITLSNRTKVIARESVEDAS
jgi:hypothetical protein